LSHKRKIGQDATSGDVERRKKIDWEGKTPQEMADLYEQSCGETWQEVRRERDTW